MHTIIMGKHKDYAELILTRPGGYLLLKDGTRYTFDEIDVGYFYFSYEPPVRTNNLIEIEHLAYGNGKWMLGKESFLDSLAEIQRDAFFQLNTARDEQQFPPVPPRDFQESVRESPKLCFLEQTPQEAAIVLQINYRFFTRLYARHWGLARLLRSEGQNKTLRREVCAAAWFEGNDTPVLLRDFSEIKSRQTAEAEDRQHLAEQSLEKTAQAANLTLREALEKWMRFEPPGMKITTQARIEKAVKLYLTDPDKHSLSKIATEFKCSRKTVSTWFAKFTKQTDFPVVRHSRHESVQAHLRADGL